MCRNNNLSIIGLFEKLNARNIEYVLLRNIGGHLSGNFSNKRDIDILVRRRCKPLFKQVLKEMKWKQIKHAWDFDNNFVFLYSMDPFEMYTNSYFLLDISYQLSCRSINKGEWMPLDRAINESIWEKRKLNEQYPWYEMDNENLLVHLLTRCIFDKKEFPDDYVFEINKLLKQVSEGVFKDKLKLVFFKFTPMLINMLNMKEFNKIIDSYISFSDY